LATHLAGDARAARDAGLLAPRTDPDSLARALIVAYLGAAFYFSHSQGLSLVEILRPMVELTLAGFSYQEASHVQRPRVRQPRRPRSG
jgi:hypothetical protein